MARPKSVFAPLLGCVLVIGAATWWWYRPRREHADLVYRVVDGAPLTLDLDLPGARRSRCPVILFVPPEGDWHRDFKREARFRMVIDALNRRGYAVATVHYRVPGKHRFPAPIEDGKAAVRWLRASAARYSLDPDRIGVVGVSAGGYGACMLGTTDAGDGLEGAEAGPGPSSRVQAVVSLGAPTDFTTKTWSELVESVYLQPFLGASYADDPALYRRASPGTYATRDDPPFLLFHSSGDEMVPVHHARTLERQLRSAGVTVDLVEVEGDAHVWDGPELERAIERALQFFDQHLLGRARGTEE
jgi:acetyl esterase/lipase